VRKKIRVFFRPLSENKFYFLHFLLLKESSKIKLKY